MGQAKGAREAGAGSPEPLGNRATQHYTKSRPGAGPLEAQRNRIKKSLNRKAVGLKIANQKVRSNRARRDAAARLRSHSVPLRSALATEPLRNREPSDSFTVRPQ